MAKNIYTVSEANRYIARLFEDDYFLKSITIEGEVSGCKYHSSGHIYFSIKDEKSLIRAVMFRGMRGGLDFDMRDGDHVLISGRVGIYEASGSYQVYAAKITRAGEGDLYAKFEQLKRDLAEMGMFDASYKKPIPRFCKRIGIVTAPTGAAVRDIIQIAQRRNPHVELILCPALVQGDGAAASVVAAIQNLDALGLDCMIVGRGGGSIEDLWAFNEEIVARAIFAAATPVISAVGHETDTTIADFVADLRAPTPSAAAELAVYSYDEAVAQLAAYRARAARAMARSLQEARRSAGEYERRLRYLSPLHQLSQKRQMCMHLEEKLQQVMEAKLDKNRTKLALFAERLDGHSPMKKMAQGYSYVRGDAGRAVTSVGDVHVDEKLTLYVKDGLIRTRVMETQPGTLM